MTVGERIAAEARAWLGTPHVNMAKVKGVGVDCGMLLIGVLEGAQIIKPDTISVAPYSNMWHLSHSEEWFLRYVQKYCDEVTDLQIGDFLLYKYGRCISHAAVYIGQDRVIHALVNQGVIVTEMSDVMFCDHRGQSRLKYIYRWREDTV